jgi:hypothetical protein
MNRAEAATFVGERYGVYLAAVGRAATDSAGNLKAAIDDALRALGYVAADIPAAEPTDPEAEEDLRVQVVYRAMAQVVRDLGTKMDVGLDGIGSFKLSQQRAAAERDLAIAEVAVLERFGTLGAVFADGDPFVTIDLNFLDDWVVA